MWRSDSLLLHSRYRSEGSMAKTRRKRHTYSNAKRISILQAARDQGLTADVKKRFGVTRSPTTVAAQVRRRSEPGHHHPARRGQSGKSRKSRNRGRAAQRGPVTRPRNPAADRAQRGEQLPRLAIRLEPRTWSQGLTPRRPPNKLQHERLPRPGLRPGCGACWSCWRRSPPSTAAERRTTGSISAPVARSASTAFHLARSGASPRPGRSPCSPDGRIG